MGYERQPITPVLARRLARRHTLSMAPGEDVWTSTGFTREYLDGQAMLLDPIYRERWAQYFEARTSPYHPVGMGASGALIIGLLGQGSVIKAPYKNHGLEAYNWAAAMNRKYVVLVDDVRFTGTTFEKMRAFCLASGLHIVKEVTAWPWTPLTSLTNSPLQMESPATKKLPSYLD